MTANLIPVKTVDGKRLYTIKIPIMGAAFVGKTSIANRLSGGGYVSDYRMTIGVDIFMRYIERDDSIYRIQLWDIAGQRRFSFLRKIFYKGAHAGIFVFDLTRRETFEILNHWIADFLSFHPRTPIIILGNKKDLEEKRAVSQADGINLAKKFSTVYIETSALTGENIERAFKLIIKRLFTSKFSVVSL
ncbi:MAG: Rab family GTPase [Candidatus Njordarchaeales archaeon]